MLIWKLNRLCHHLYPHLVFQAGTLELFHLVVMGRLRNIVTQITFPEPILANFTMSFLTIITRLKKRNFSGMTFGLALGPLIIVMILA